VSQSERQGEGPCEAPQDTPNTADLSGRGRRSLAAFGPPPASRPRHGDGRTGASDRIMLPLSATSNSGR
jgi:hypothetical protein